MPCRESRLRMPAGRAVRRAVCVLLVALMLAAPFAAAQLPAPAPPSVVALDLRGAIGPATTEYLRRGLDIAQARRAVAVVLRLDTPGGLATSMRDIVRAILASPVPVICHVTPGGAQAASAGTYILYACHVAAMAAGTNLGAATPVQLGGAPGGAPPAPDSSPAGNDKPDQPADASPAALERKTVNDAAAFIRSLAQLRGRNADWAEAAVREATSLPAHEAVKRKVVDIMADGMEELLAQADGREVKTSQATMRLAVQGANVIEVPPDWRTRFLGIITNPNFAYLFMLLGIYGIVFELMNPGSILPGVIGAVALVTALFALNMLPVSYAGLGLVLLGMGLMAVEAFTPTLGLLGLGGAVVFALGSLFLFDTPLPDYALSLPLVLTTTALSAVVLFLIFAAALRARRRQPVSDDAALLGQAAQVLAWHGDHGQVQMGSEIWQARASTPLTAGAAARVVARDGLVLTVRANDAPVPVPPQRQPQTPENAP